MMKTTLLLFACILVTALLAAGCTSIPGAGISPTASPTGTFPVTTTLTCGFTSCTGLNLACSWNPPEACPALYQLGDKCRQYAFCNDTGGSCSLVTTPEFTSCKACIEKCGGADPAEIFSCEEKC